MAKDLVVVESPAKARTISRILGNRYEVKASLGHVRDLPPDELGVEVSDGFTPNYVVLKEKRPAIREIKKLAAAADAIYLATDPDREGEAISWHLVHAASLKDQKIRRVVFHEITEEAVQRAFRHPRSIDMALVNAQQARRILDRLVGYRLSPLLWKKIRWPGLSAGRVQSAALRIVVEREREVQGFTPVEYWTIEAKLIKTAPPDTSPFAAQLHSRIEHGKAQPKLHIPKEADAQRLIQDLEGATFTVGQVKEREVRTRPAPPFITSTLQQEAWRKLRFSAKKTMLLAQQLYEGIDLGQEGPVGLITYMRTDSTHVAEGAKREARAYIQEKFGARYLPASARSYTSKVKGAQEAHEAIRPTSVGRGPQAVKAFLTPDQDRLYELVWKRFLASQMADALSHATSADIHAQSALSGTVYLFRAAGSVLTFAGFRSLYIESKDDPEDEDAKALPPLAQGEALRCLGLDSGQHFTQPPPRYTEASLVKALEERGIGRPSTYAAIVSTIQDRSYVKKEGGRLFPQPLGIVVNDLLTQHFPEVVDLGFTAHMEEELDDVAQGQRQWAAVLKEFYTPFAANLASAEKGIPRVHIPSEETCDLCGRPMVIKHGRFGQFLSCSGFPECRSSKPIRVKAGVLCPRCAGDLLERRARKKGRRSVFYGCSNYPTCNFTVNRRPLPQPCPECSGLLVAAGQRGAQCTQCHYKGPAPAEEREAAEV